MTPATAYRADLNLASISVGGAFRSDTVPAATSAAEAPPHVVYTAFDGDHFALTPLMRRHVLSHGGLPLNPESVVGYRASLEAYGTKFGVLTADVAVVDKVTAIWIYTDVVREAVDLPNLAEGVLLELLWYLRSAEKRKSRADVRLVSVDQLLTGDPAFPGKLVIDYATAKAILTPTHHDLVDRLSDIDRWGVPELVLAIHHPADTKYRDWIRAYAHARHIVAVVPSHAIEVDDDDLDAVAQDWLDLLFTVDRVWNFPSIDRRPSLWADCMLDAARRRGLSIDLMSWVDVRVPKAVHGSAWPLTTHEAETIAADKSAKEGSDRS